MESLEVSAKTVDEAVEKALERLDARLSEVEIVVLSEGRAGILGLGAEDARIRVTKLDTMQTGRSRISGANFPPRPPAIYADHPGLPQDEEDWEGEEELGPTQLETRPAPQSQNRNRGRGGAAGGGPRRDGGQRPPGGQGGQPRPMGASGGGQPRPGGQQGGGQRSDRGGQRSDGRGGPRGDRGPRGERGERGGDRGDRRQREPAIRPQQRTDRVLPEPGPASSPLAETARTIVQEMVTRMGLHAVVVETKPPVADDPANPTPVLAFDVQGDDLGSLIGRRGQTLSSLQYLVNLMVRQQTKESLMIIVDVEGYRARRYGSLASLAHRMAERVRSSGQAITLEPMTAAERRIIHMTLKDYADLTTQSVGEGEARKVNIIPKKKA